MASKNDPPGLLSKVALFVRNPTKDWSELDRLQAGQGSSYDKQALKAMIERKRQNDFVRNREFDKLRKLRKAGNRGSEALAAAAAAAAKSSDFSSLDTDPDGRAVTLKKIDDIEAQMSKQWWKGKQDATVTQQLAVAPTVPATGGIAGEGPLDKTSTPAVPAQTFTLPEHSDLRGETDASGFLATQMGMGMPPPAPGTPPPPATVPGPFATSRPGSDFNFFMSKLAAIEVEEHIATDSELEEAAIRFANGADAEAESGLLAALRGDAMMPENAASWAAALLDLYRATGNQAGFVQATTEFTHYFAATPHWLVIGAQPAPAAPAAAAPAPALAPVWSSLDVLTAHDMEALRSAMAASDPPWHLDWSSLERIDISAMPLLDSLFASLCAEPVALGCTGADCLVDALRQLMPSGDRSVDPHWWLVRLNVLCVLRLQDEFEMVALDYCVTFERPPPPWKEAACQYEQLDTFDDSHHAATMPMGLHGVQAVTLELQGDILGDATEALAGANQNSHSGAVIVIACGNLVRVDFLAAGSILNWVTARHAQGCKVQFRDVHRLVAAFFHVIGISEYARVTLRHL